MYVFRESQRAAPAGRLLAELADSIRRAAFSDHQDALLDALLRAGELECCLADAEYSEAAAKIAGVTDCLASALVHGDRLAVAESCLQILAQIEVFGKIALRIPEGFAYYALHPLDYARGAEKLLADSGPDSLAVIGIRTIGTTLSAVVAAAIRQHRVPASRATVRPTGHPFERECVFTPEQREWIAEHKAARFIVVDEGPGLSGSSFLSVARALEREGVGRQQITLLCSHLPKVAAFKSSRSREQWENYSALQAARDVPDAGVDLSFGGWKQLLFGRDEEWPSSWAQMERRKSLNAEAGFEKFEGLGKYGEAAFARASRLAEAGFGAPVLGRDNGYARYRWIDGRPLRKGDLDQAVITRIAEYCAFRASEFIAEPGVQEGVDLESMTRVNLLEEFGSDEVGCDLSVLNRGPNVVTDSRMQPHYWLRTPAGKIIKTSGSLHGDDHFFPGPCNVAWDLAGAIVEWDMAEENAVQLLRSFELARAQKAAHEGHEVPRRSLEAYLVAYSAFRMGFCKMGAEAMAGTEEESRLRRDFLKYRGILHQHLRATEIAGANFAQPKTPRLRSGKAPVPHNKAA